MKYKIKIHNNINNLTFGTNKSTVRKQLGNFEIINKRDMFKNCFAEYRNEKLISIEIFAPFTIEINNITFFSNDTFEEMRRKILLLDSETKFDECGATSRNCSIGTYFENGFETFLVAEKGYYD